MKNDGISVLVCTYNPVWEKLLLTLKSIVIQQKIDVQLVVTDDGSHDSMFQKIKEFLKAQNFKDYILVPHEINHGTVSNIADGIQYCKYEYVKCISPGDFFAAPNVLFSWKTFAEEQRAEVSFCNAIYYQIVNDKFQAMSKTAEPQRIYIGAEKNMTIKYLLLNDLAVGATVLMKTCVLKKYIDLINGKVKYAEDHVLRILAAEETSFFTWNYVGIYYEYGLGVSTQGNDIWNKRLYEDWLAGNQIILNESDMSDMEKDKFRKWVSLIKNNSFISKIQRTIMVPSYCLYRLKRKIFPRRTNTEIDMQYIDRLLNIK